LIFLENLANTQFPRIPVFNTDPPFRAGAIIFKKMEKIKSASLMTAIKTPYKQDGDVDLEC